VEFPGLWLSLKGVAMSVEVSPSGLSDNAASGLAYITVIPAIIFLIIEPYNHNREVRFHSWQSIFFAVAGVVIDVGLMILGRLPGLRWSAFFLGPLIGLGFFLLWVFVLINAVNGKHFKIPVVGDLAEKQANS
jgi:uncharacterized membrane protein